jgi:hypothetical protein
MSHPSTATRQIYGIPITGKLQHKGERSARRFFKKYGGKEGEVFPLSAVDNEILGPIFGLKQVVSENTGESIDYANALFIGTIRMGYGHYRIGMALASAAHSKGLIPYWHDLLGFDSAGARAIRDLDRWYSLGSRISQKSKLFNKLLWDPLMGKWYKRFEKNYPVMEAARIFADTHRDIPPDTPFLATHPFNAHGALYAGLNRVVNIVPDNCPLGFHIAPGALHTVQSPSSYFIFRTLRDLGAKESTAQGIPEYEVHITGHYIDHELVSNIPGDCDARLRRMRDKEPRRLLVSIGGAGAQQQLIIDIITHLMPMIQAEKVTLFLNCGDHRNVLSNIATQVHGFKEHAVEHIEWPEMQAFATQSLQHYTSGLHVFCHDNPFVAVYATNMLMRTADILLTKPSELAFYPIPKLLIERVGGHEAWGAIRAAELGDGTPECSGTTFTLQALDTLIHENDLLELYCSRIGTLHQQGIYDGAYRAIDLATKKQ